jgi:peptidyl-prolyl cis-trans isomerase D
MTMLDRMRRHKAWLKWSLALVCLAFVIFYIPDFLTTGTTTGVAAPSDVVAEVNGRTITAGEFGRVYRAQMQAYQGAYGANASEQLLKQLGIDQQILQQMIDEQAAIIEAERLGISVTDAEVRERILALPAFQENGHFIGEERYRQLLRAQNPPMTPSDFEDRVRRGAYVEKLRSAVTHWLSVSDAELEREYRRRNEKVRLDVVTFMADTFIPAVSVSDAEIAAHFEKNQETYRVPEKRKVRYLLVDMQALREKVTVAAADVERLYNNQIDQFSSPEQVRASHILIETGTDEAAARKRAEEVLAKARAGEDFAALAKQYSQDESNKDQGGDLDFFGRGRMVPAFEEAAFALQPGAISDLVKTDYGFHVIKVTEKRGGETKPLSEVRQQLEDQLKWERAQAQATTIANELSREIDDPSDLDRMAQARGLKVEESGFFARTEPLAGLGFSPEAAAAAFELADGAVSQAIRTPQGFAFLTVTGKSDARLPKLDEVKDKVKEDVTRAKAVDAARAKANEVAPALKTAADFAAAAKAAGLEAKPTELVARGAALPDVGVNAAVESVAFALKAGQVSDPIATDAGVVVLRVAERQEMDQADFAKTRETLREELLNEQRGRFFTSYMNKAKERMTIEIDPETVAKVTA